MNGEELCDFLAAVDRVRWNDKSQYESPQVDVVTMDATQYPEFSSQEFGPYNSFGGDILTIDSLELSPDGTRIIIYVKP